MSNTQVAIDAIHQLAIADEEIQKLRAENEALKANLAAIREPLTQETIIKLSAGNRHPGSTQTIKEFAHAIHQAILARIEERSNESTD